MNEKKRKKNRKSFKFDQQYFSSLKRILNKPIILKLISNFSVHTEPTILI